MSEETIYTLGKTGDTVIHVFPNGNARMHRRGKTNSQQTSKAHTPQPEEVKLLKVHSANPVIPAVTDSQQTYPSKSLTPMSNSESASVEVLGQSLIQAGLITPGQYQVACHDQAVTGMSLIEALVARGWLASPS
ncbi:MAG TPA: hypothetical protein V6D29_16385 [Leptolyngbyaceae cyanobacterium]